MEESSTSTTRSLVDVCVKAAVQGNAWRQQRRQLERLPEHGANAMLALLLAHHRITAPQLELFRRSVTSVEIPSSCAAAITAEWLSYIVDFSYLTHLDLSGCTRLKDANLSLLATCAPTLASLSVARCSGVTARSLPLFAGLGGLRSLDISETGIRGSIIHNLTALTALTTLRLGGLSVNDADLSHVPLLPQLRTLSLWGAEIGDDSIASLAQLRQLSELDISWTWMQSLPILPGVQVLRACHLSWQSIYWPAADGSGSGSGTDEFTPLRELYLASSAVERGSYALQELMLLLMMSPELISVDLSGIPFTSCNSLSATCHITRLNLSGTAISDAAELAYLTHLDSLAVLTLAKTPLKGHVFASLAKLPKLQVLDLSHINMEDDGLQHLPQLTALKQLNLSHTCTTWAVEFEGPPGPPLSSGGVIDETEGELHARTPWTYSGLEAAVVASDPLVSSPQEASPGKQLPRSALLSLDASSSLITTAGAAKLAALCADLSSLCVGSARLSNAGLARLATLAHLQSLVIANCSEVTDEGMHLVVRAPSLASLEVLNCWLVTDEGLKQLDPVSPLLLHLVRDGRHIPLSSRSRNTTSEASSRPAIPSGIDASRTPAAKGFSTDNSSRSAGKKGLRSAGVRDGGTRTSNGSEDGGLEVGNGWGSPGFGDERVFYTPSELLAMRDAANATAVETIVGFLPDPLRRGWVV